MRPCSLLLAAIFTLALLALAPSAHAQITVDTAVNFKIVNKNSGLVLSIQSASKTAGATAVQATDDGSPNVLWHFLPDGNNVYKIVNVNSAELLGISGASLSMGADAVQWADNATNDHLWKAIDAGGGEVKLQNVNSGLVLGVSGASRSSGAIALQWTDNGTTDHLWALVPSGSAYVNPGSVSGSTSVHDPSMLRTAGGTYYVFSTHNGIQMRSSSDRRSFASVGNAFSTIPAWTGAFDNNGNDLWAPDASNHNGQYWLYYAASTFGSEHSAIGLATSSTAAPGSWIDQGMVYSSASGGSFNAIDPGLVVDTSGNWWLCFGSWGQDGIDMIQIDPATGKQAASNTTRYNLAKRTPGHGIEGAYIYPHAGFYYLFASLDLCCKGISSTYHIVVGRSTNPNGPYTDRGGIPLTQGGGTILLSTHGSIIGPGGQSVMHDTDGDLLVYHYYDGNNNGTPLLGINLLGWDSQQWPFLH